MGRIVYKPHCAKCGALIEQNVQFKRYENMLKLNKNLQYKMNDYVFSPYRCKVCGEIFDSAEVQIPEEVECFETV